MARRPPLEMPPVLGESMRWAGLTAVLYAIAVAFALAMYVLSKRKDEEVDRRASILTAELLAIRRLRGDAGATGCATTSAGRAVLVAGRRAARRGRCGVPGVPGGNGATQ